MWKFSSTLEEKVINKVKSYFDEHKESHKKFEFLEEIKPHLVHLDENFEVFKKVIDQSKMNNNLAIYKYIEYEINDLKDRFNKNYNNGSEKEKSIQETSISQQKLLNMLNSAMIKANDRKSIGIFITFIFERIQELINELSNLTEYSSKLSLITIYFNNINVLVSFFNLKEIDYIEKDEKSLKNILCDDFKNLVNNLIIRKKSLSEEYV